LISSPDPMIYLHRKQLQNIKRATSTFNRDRYRQ